VASVQVLTLRAVNRALLARQLLLERQVLPAAGPARSAQVVRTIEHLVGLQAQAPFPPYYGLHSRLDGFGPEDLAALITDRSVVRIALTAEAERVLAFAAPGAAHEVRFAPLAGTQLRSR
jgi:hypothetical protein